jgi:hypothetical protein
MDEILSNVTPIINGNYYTYIFDNPNPDNPGNYITFDKTYDVNYLIVGGGGSGYHFGGAGGSYSIGNEILAQNNYIITVGSGNSGSTGSGGSSSFNNNIAIGGQTGVNSGAGTQGGSWVSPDSTVYYFSGGGGSGGDYNLGGYGGGGADSSGSNNSGVIGGNGGSPNGAGGGGNGGNGGASIGDDGFGGDAGGPGYSDSLNGGGAGGPGGNFFRNGTSGGGGGGGGGGYGGGGGGSGMRVIGPGGAGSNGVVILVVSLPSPTITNFPNLTKTILDISFTLVDPSSNSTGAFTYSSSNTGVASVSGNVVSVLKKGTSTITATQEATDNFLSGNIDASLTILNNICFPSGTPITCDQGNIPIDHLNPKVHTIRGKKIVAITQTITPDKSLICFEKDSLGPNIPSQKTLISKKHKIFYKGKMMEAQEFVGKFDAVYRVKYSGEILYNVLMEKYEKMMVNNLICETLHPENIVARLYSGNYSPSEFNDIVLSMNECVKKQDRNKFLSICKTIK